MKLTVKNPPRTFTVGQGEGIKIKDCAHISLSANEQVTFTTESGAEYDVARKEWGFYATPSLNGRLTKFGLRAVLVKHPATKHFYLFLVEAGKEKGVENYIQAEGHQIICWMDSDETLENLEKKLKEIQKMKIEATSLRCLCEGGHFTEMFTYTRPPKDEIRFQSASHETYYRKIYRCSSCGHFLSVHDMDLSKLYAGDYVTSNYENEEGLRRAFERIISLDPSRSDNRGRVQRILDFVKERSGDQKRQDGRLSVLDVGSGLCVFLHAMKQAGWDSTALDPDPRAAKHAESVVGVRVIQGDFLRLKPSERYDLVTFNKVLEHVGDPVAMLARSREFVKEKGIVYVELPDGELAWRDGPEREEFAIDHPHIFSLTSLSILATRAGFSVRHIERLREPSTKYTLRAFLTPQT